MKTKIIEGINDISSIIINSNNLSFREVSLMLLKLLEDLDLVSRKLEKKHFPYETTCEAYTFTYKYVYLDKYYDMHIYGCLNTSHICEDFLKSLEKYLISFSSTEIEEFIESYMIMINNIFPCGEHANSYNTTYACQNIDFDVKTNNNSDKPSLLDMKISKNNIFTQLMCSLFTCGFSKEGIAFYKSYFSKYNITVRTLMLELFNPENRIISMHKYLTKQIANNFTEDKTKDNLECSIYDDLPIDDLRYVLNLVKSEYAIIEKNSNWKIHFFKTLKKYCNCGGIIETPISEENLDKIMEEIYHISDTWRAPEFKYITLHSQNEELRYYLSILYREYYAIWKIEKTTKQNYLDYIDSIVEILDERIEKQEKEYLKEILDFSEKDLKTLFIKFLKSCEKCRILSEYQDYNFDNIDYEKLYDKVKKSADIIKRIAAAQNRLDKLVDLNLTDGDFTYLVVSQIKAIELYLKLVITTNMKGVRIYSSYNFKTGNPINSDDHLTLNDNNIEKLISGKFPIQLATSAYIINNNKQLCFENTNLTAEDDLYFNPRPPMNSFNDRLFKKWIDKTRNGYFHTHPITNINDALQINYKTAFCFYRVIDLLKPLK